MNNRIQLLPPDIINKIAAGEVVERPASIAKEFLENALDAEATEIVLSLENSGLDSVTCHDNGSGMNSEEAKTALLQHATSKISSLEDLFDIHTMGFRGEALASIASVSEVSIHTYNGSDRPVTVTASSKGIATKLGSARNRGTTISAAGIFSDIPARRKFLKSEATEYKYIYDTFISIALTRPDISFELIRNEKSALKLNRTDDSKARILQVFKALSDKDLIAVYFDDPRVQLQGWVGHPETAGRSTAQQFIFINGRYIKNALIAKAVKEGFATGLMPQMQPSFFLFLTIDNKIVDVNVHPRKLEVRFSDSSLIFNAVRRAVAAALNKELQKRITSNFENLTPFKSAGPARAATPKSSVQASMEFTKQLLQKEQALNSPTSYTNSVVETSDNRPITPMPAQLEQINGFQQIFNTYLIFVKDDKLLFIDQHAAHERVNFERISKSLAVQGKLASQDLLVPERFHSDPSESEDIRKNMDTLTKLGFQVSELKDDHFVISSIPILIHHFKIRDIVIEIINDLKNSEATVDRWREIKDKLIATLACHSSIRAGEKIPAPIAEKLIADLFLCDLPYSCPHGRPIIWELERSQLEKNFKRII